MSNDNAYQWKETGGPVCPGCGQKQIINQYKHLQWRCGSFWSSELSAEFHQSDWCQRFELNELRKSISDLRNELENHKREQKRQDAFIYHAPCGQRLKD